MNTTETPDRADIGSSNLLEVALRVLNEAYRADPAALHALVNQRVPCNRGLADHPTIQVGTHQFGETESFYVGIVGILNGVIEAATGQRIAVAISDDGEGTVTGFVPYTPNDQRSRA